MNRLTDGKTEKQIDRQTNKWMTEHTNRLAGRQVDRELDRLTKRIGLSFQI
jgi:hypothetical protein